MKIQLTVSNQHIEAKVPAKVVADTRNYLEANFFFVTSEWEGVEKTAVFSNQLGTYNVLLTENKCAVPWEVLTAGDLSISVFGGDRITTDVAKVRIFPSGYKYGETPREPTPDVYAEILDRLRTIQGGTVSEADIKSAVQRYMEENPLETLTQEDVEGIVEGYLQVNPPQVDVSQDVESFIQNNKDTLFPKEIPVVTGTISSVDDITKYPGTYRFKEAEFLVGGSKLTFSDIIAWVENNALEKSVSIYGIDGMCNRIAYDESKNFGVYEAFHVLYDYDLETEIAEAGTGQLYSGIVYTAGEVGSEKSYVFKVGFNSKEEEVFVVVFTAKTDGETPLFSISSAPDVTLVPRIFGTVTAGETYRAEYRKSDGVLRIS